MGGSKESPENAPDAGRHSQLLDWNSKSRKRLFSGEHDIPGQIKPVEKFHMEILPPKSDKAIPITRHKLLSPIKTLGFVPSKHAAHIMDGAARITNHEPRAIGESKGSLAGSCSAPLRMLELKEKLAVAQRPSQRRADAGATKCMRTQSPAKSFSSSVDKDNNASMNDKGKSISLAVQAKLNVQRRESLSSMEETLCRLKESEEIRPSQVSSKTEPHSLRSADKKSSVPSASLILRQNNQKQNRSTDNGRSTSKASVPDSLGRKKSASSGHCLGQQTSLCKDNGNLRSSRRSNLEARDHAKETLSPEAQNTSQKKRFIDENLQHGKIRAVDNIRSSSNQPSPSVVTADAWNKAETKTWTGTTPVPEALRQVGDKITSQADNQNKNMLLSSDDTKLFSLGIDVASTDALGILIDQKLREYSSTQDKCITMAKLEESLAPSPVSILGPSLLTESYTSSESEASNSTQESQHCLSYRCSISESGADLLDSASSTPCRKSPTSSDEWELDYIKGILCNVELMFKDYTLGRTREVMNPHIFDHLEKRRTTKYHRGETRLARKLMFDCVRQCMDMRCKHLAGGGGYKQWAKGVAMVRAKGRLAEEVYRDVQDWRSMWHCMVDELVDDDMSGRHGSWLDFELDGFALGKEIESRICDSLIDEAIADIMPLSCTNSFISASEM